MQAGITESRDLGGARALIAAVLAWLLLVAGRWLLGLEFESWKAERFVTLALFGMPILFFPLTFRIRKRSLRWTGIVLSGLIAAAAVPLTCFATMGLSDIGEWSQDLSFLPVVRQPTPPYSVVLYRTNCGATCAFGLVLRQERHLMPGLHIVRTIGRWYPADTGTLTLLPSDRAVVEVVTDAPSAKVDTIKLRTSLLLPW